MVSVPARRAGVKYATGKGLSQRRACTLLKVGRSALDYRSRKAERDAPALACMAALAAQYPRYGYRRIAIFLRREGHGMSFSRAYRLWRQARLQVPRKRPRKRIANGRPRPKTPTGANEVWSYDFVFDSCANGQKLKCLTVEDEWTKEGLAIEVDGRIRSVHVIEVLTRLISQRGAQRRRSARASDGAERCDSWSLRAPPRRKAVPQGTNTRSNGGGRLKLNVVRRKRAGHRFRAIRTRIATILRTAESPNSRHSGQVGDSGSSQPCFVSSARGTS
jgi:hypothetical protein